MNTEQIQSYLGFLYKLHNIKIPVIVAAADTLNHTMNKHKLFAISIIQNTDKIKDPGEHWICYMLLSKNNCEYFDSYGNVISTHKNMQRPCKNIVRENCLVLQSPNSYLCGGYCIYFLYYRGLGFNYRQILDSFSSSVSANDRKIEKFVRSIQKSMKCRQIRKTKFCQTNLCRTRCKRFH